MSFCGNRTNCVACDRIGDILPANFDRIPLSRIQIDKLRGLGVLYNERTGRRGYAVDEGEDESDEV